MASGQRETVDEPEDEGEATQAQPGLLVVFSGERPAYAAIELGEGGVTFGRVVGAHEFPDELLSRQHAEISFDGRAWRIRDLGSRNKTRVDGEQVGDHRAAAPICIRMGKTLVLPVADLGPHLGDIAVDGVRVSGPSFTRTLTRVRRAAASTDTLLVIGESGTGKELCAREFHVAGPHRKGPFIAVNCAAIPEGVAERLLFGARRGAYSGAVDADGYLQAADGGVLFLDEIGELELAVQAKLLRVLETREVLALGATSARAVDVRLCSATHRDLRAEVAAQRFRADLFFRIAGGEVRIAPLRERREEIPWLVAQEIARSGSGRAADARFVEACLLRPWPGNVRELLHAVRRACHDADAGQRLELTANTGRPLVGDAIPAGAAETDGGVDPAQLTREEIEAALSANQGRVAATARMLGLHRTQLYRLLERFGLRAKS